MSSMPFPSGTWNFLAVPLGSGPSNLLVNAWGKLTFQSVGVKNQLVLQVGLVSSQPVDVSWSSVTPDIGTIASNPNIIVGAHSYAFTTITVMIMPLGTVTHRVAFCLQATVDGAAAWVMAVPDTSALLPPKAGSYTVQDAATGASLCILNAADTGNVSVTAEQGYSVNGPVAWQNPKVNWPPIISWSLKETSSGAILSFTGALTTSANPLLRQITWQFGGKYHKGPPAGDDDWTSTTKTDPFLGVRAYKTYA
jgi:hypothetical protein